MYVVWLIVIVVCSPSVTALENIPGTYVFYNIICDQAIEKGSKVTKFQIVVFFACMYCRQHQLHVGVVVLQYDLTIAKLELQLL